MVGLDDLRRIVIQNPSKNRKGEFQFVTGLSRRRAERKAKAQGLEIIEGSFIGRGTTYRLIGYRRKK